MNDNIDEFIEIDADFNDSWNEDIAYDRMRDAESDAFDYALTKVLRDFYNTGIYYKGSLWKLQQHAIANITSLKEKDMEVKHVSNTSTTTK